NPRGLPKNDIGTKQLFLQAKKKEKGRAEQAGIALKNAIGTVERIGRPEGIPQVPAIDGLQQVHPLIPAVHVRQRRIIRGTDDRRQKDGVRGKKKTLSGAAWRRG